MIDWSQIEDVLDKQSVSEDDQNLVRDFLSSFSFSKRQQLMGIFLGFPEKIGLFVELVKKKVKFANSMDKSLADDILHIENDEIDNLIKDLED